MKIIGHWGGNVARKTPLVYLGPLLGVRGYCG